MLTLPLLFFFFQAEDGIRDWSVTGVQTCALPISVTLQLPLDPNVTVSPESALALTVKSASPKILLASAPKRSEERRVGKECRARGSPGVTRYKLHLRSVV